MASHTGPGEFADWIAPKFNPIELPAVDEIDESWYQMFGWLYGDGSKKVVVDTTWCLRQLPPFNGELGQFEPLDLARAASGNRAVIDGTVRGVDIVSDWAGEISERPYVTLAEAEVAVNGMVAALDLVQDPRQHFMVPLPPEGCTLFLYDK